MDPYVGVRDSYATFAREARDSPCFVAWSLGVVDDAEVSELIASLPQVKQQPNLVFAAARWHGAPAPGPYAGLREVLLERWEEVRETILARSTQTNEAGRMATLLPAFSAITTRPLALVEVGSSAGLTLHPDKWSYAWHTSEGAIEVGDPSSPRLTCAVEGPVRLPADVPTVAWRGGIDLNPLDPSDPETAAWLENLVWPEQHERRERLRTAIRVARPEPVHIVTGDLLEELPAMVEAARRRAHGATVIVFHSAVIAYLPPERRTAFDGLMRQLVADGRCHWVSNESPTVLPDVTRTAPARGEDETRFVLGVDGRAVGLAHGHGASLTWF